jgi:hypothetical protein
MCICHVSIQNHIYNQVEYLDYLAFFFITYDLISYVQFMHRHIDCHAMSAYEWILY